MTSQISSKSLFSASIMNLKQLLRNKMISKSNDKNNINKNNKINLHETYEMPLEVIYHDQRFLFMSKPCKHCKELIDFHGAFSKYNKSIFERYGWNPSLNERVSIDCNACLLGYAINIKTNIIMGMITLFNLSNYKEELSLIVLPPYQRQHIATDLVKLTWTLFADQNNESWIYVTNSCSIKSPMFWKTFNQCFNNNDRIIRSKI